MFSCTEWTPSDLEVGDGSRAPNETLHMLSLVLKTAFRMHCTGETVCDQRPWQLVEGVRRKLVELSQELESVVSEDKLAGFVGTVLCPPEAGAGGPPDPAGTAD